MRSPNLTLAGDRLARLVEHATVKAILFWGFIALAPVLAVLTFLTLSEVDLLIGSEALRVVLLADFVYALVVAAFVARRLVEMLAARRRRSEGSRLHLRLMRVFTLVALVPTVLVAVFATITVNFGLEGWFSDRVRNVVANSLAAAQAYEEEHRTTLQSDAAQLAGFLDAQKERYPLLTGGLLRELLTRGQTQMQRALPKAYVIDSAGEIRARGERSYLFDFNPPSPAEIARAQAGEVVVIEDWANNEFRALLKLDAFADYFLYVSRAVDGKILSLLDDTQATVLLYQQLEADRGRLVFEFALIYLGFAVVVILGAIWMGLWFAERLARPVGQLAAAAMRVGAGDLDARVPESRQDDEIALLGRAFNTMTRQVKGQRDALIEANIETERRRRLFDSVLKGVTAGVVGLDGEGRIEVMNAAAATLLGLDPEMSWGQPLRDVERLKSFPGQPPQGSSCPASDRTPRASAAGSRLP
ncbi:PAS domain-containing sensor histidine kinase, partial [Amaricoccus sp. HAR-UPW-R2A-40]